MNLKRTTVPFKYSLPIFALSYLVAILFPLHIHPYRVFFNDLAISIGVLIVFSSFAVHPHLAFRIPRIVWLPISMILMMGLQAMLMPNLPVWDWPLGIAYLLLAAIAITIGASMTEIPGGKEKIGDWLALCFWLAALISALGAWFQVLGISIQHVLMSPTMIKGLPRAYANVAQPNMLALILMLGLAAQFWLSERSAWIKWAGGKIGTLFALFLVSAIVLTQSRNAWMILPCFTGLVGWRYRQQKQRLAVVLGLAVCYVGMILALPQFAELLGYADWSLEDRLGARSERRVLWAQSLEMANSHPFLGVGFAAWGLAQIDIAEKFSPSIYSEHAHNLVLHLAAEMGWIYTVFFFGVLIVWAKKHLWRQIHQPFGLFVALCLTAVFMHSMVEFPLWYGYILFTTALLMGLTYCEIDSLKSYRLPSPMVLGGFFIGCAILALSTLEYTKVTRGFRAWQMRQAGYLVEVDLLRKPTRTLFPQYFDYFAMLDVQPKEGMSADEITSFEMGTRRFGYVHILNRLTEIYLLNNRLAEAVRTAHKLHSLHPYSYDGYYDYWVQMSKKDVRFKALLDQVPPKFNG